MNRTYVRSLSNLFMDMYGYACYTCSNKVPIVGTETRPKKYLFAVNLLETVQLEKRHRRDLFFAQTIWMPYIRVTHPARCNLVNIIDTKMV